MPKPVARNALHGTGWVSPLTSVCGVRLVGYPGKINACLRLPRYRFKRRRGEGTKEKHIFPVGKKICMNERAVLRGHQESRMVGRVCVVNRNTNSCFWAAPTRGTADST